ncbi:MAG: HAD hydrolase family protein [Candidatus Riflebacteria bacterium]|nr:HAD hydrolase family protein [Candidatus Riflebacteria bacterium]
MTTSKVKALPFKEACKNIKMLLFDCDGVLTDGRIVLGSSGSEMKFFYTCDGLGLKIWRDCGFTSGCITGRSSEPLEKRAYELKFDELHMDIQNKAAVMTEIAKRRGLELSEIAFIGDDLNDLAAGSIAGLFFLPANANRRMVPYADYVLKERGGHGAVREAIDLILEHKGLWNEIELKYLNNR